MRALDGDTVLAEIDFPWNYGDTHTFALRVTADRPQSAINSFEILNARSVFAPIERLC